jgi:hypothetical protein
MVHVFGFAARAMGHTAEFPQYEKFSMATGPHFEDRLDLNDSYLTAENPQ